MERAQMKKKIWVKAKEKMKQPNTKGEGDTKSSNIKRAKRNEEINVRFWSMECEVCSLYNQGLVQERSEAVES